MRSDQKMFFNLEDIAKMFDVQVRTVRRWRRNGKIQAAYIGSKYWVSKEDLEQFFQERVGKQKESAKGNPNWYKRRKNG